MMRPFKNRADAGRALARTLSTYAAERESIVVLGLPRGGMPVASEVAQVLRAPLDVCVVRKVGVPGQPELAMGAVASGGVRVRNPDILRALYIPPETFDELADHEEEELRRREATYRKGRPPEPVAGRTAMLVDDGLATGATMRAAVRATRRRGAARVIVAVPVAAPDACHALAREADEVYCLLRPDPLGSIGHWYEDFDQVSDDEVRRCLERAAPIVASSH